MTWSGTPEEKRAKQREYMREWRKSHPDVGAKYMKTVRSNDREAAREKARKEAKLWRQRHPLKAKQAYKSYRARQANVPHEDWDREALCDRDGWVCQMERCIHPNGRGIDPQLSPQHRWAGTGDHIIPISCGGPDVMSNLRAAHRACNSSNRNEQMCIFKMTKGED